MSLRARLVLALLVLFAGGLLVYGVASYRAFAAAESARLDEQLRGSVTQVSAQLGLEPTGTDPVGDGPRGRRGWGQADGPDGPPRLVTPGTYVEVHAADGAVADRAQVGRTDARPAVPEDLPDPGEVVTLDSVDGQGSWRATTAALEDGGQLLVAVPTTELDAALGRLLGIQLTAGTALLLALAGGAWVILRRGLQPLERIAASTRTIGATNLDARVPEPTVGTEVRQVATALNAMLDDLEGAFREREATEAKLRRFLADASHELRTPLTSIQGYAELFRLARTSDEVDLELVMRRIEGEAGRMRGLVEDLLALARLDETHEPVREPVDLVGLAADAAADAAAVDPDRDVALDAPAPVVVPGDARHLRQAIGNLVSNALRHTPAGTAVGIAVHRDGEVATITVRDHGPGLGADAAHVFDRFWQADPARAGAGAGLGLSIVEAVAAEHGGTVDAGDAPDGGAVFTVTLPATDVPAPGQPAAAPSTADLTSTRPQEPPRGR